MACCAADHPGCFIPQPQAAMAARLLCPVQLHSHTTFEFILSKACLQVRRPSSPAARACGSGLRLLPSPAPPGQALQGLYQQPPSQAPQPRQLWQRTGLDSKGLRLHQIMCTPAPAASSSSRDPMRGLIPAQQGTGLARPTLSRRSCMSAPRWELLRQLSGSACPGSQPRSLWASPPKASA